MVLILILNGGALRLDILRVLILILGRGGSWRVGGSLMERWPGFCSLECVTYGQLLLILGRGGSWRVGGLRIGRWPTF